MCGGERYTITEWTHPCAPGAPPPQTRFALPATRERLLSMPQTGEKERDYLFKESYKLKSNDLTSSLRSQSPLEYPQTHSPSFPLCPVHGTVSQKKKSKSVVLLCPSRMGPKRCHMAAEPGFKSQRQSPFSDSAHNWPQLLFFSQLYWAAMVSPGRCGPVVWRQSSLNSHAGSVTRGSCLPVTSWVEVTPIPLAQSMATAI